MRINKCCIWTIEKVSKCHKISKAPNLASLIFDSPKPLET
jgi:hypothetical protein